MCASSLAHAFGGWPPLARELAGHGVPGDLAGGMAVGWLFGSGAMAACGVLVLLARRELRRGVALPVLPPAPWWGRSTSSSGWPPRPTAFRTCIS
jgi:hypothetical protein